MIKKISNPAFKLFLAVTIITLFTFFNGNTYAQTKKDWPSFHGADRTNKSAETGLLKEWPSGGPALIWTVTGLGDGYSSALVACYWVLVAGFPFIFILSPPNDRYFCIEL